MNNNKHIPITLLFLLSMFFTVQGQIEICEGNYQLMTTEGKISSPVYRRIFDTWSGGYGGAKVDDTTRVLLDTLGQVVRTFKCENISTGGRKARAIIMKNGKRGIVRIDDGREIIPFKYDEILFDAGIYRIREGKLWGLMDTLGRVILPPTYLSIESFPCDSCNYTTVKKTATEIDSKTGKPFVYSGVINRQGELVYPLENRGLNVYSCPGKSFYAVKLPGRGEAGATYFVDKQTNQTLNTEPYEYFYGVGEDKILFPVKRKLEWIYAFVDRSGKQVTDFIYDQAFSCEYGSGGIGRIGNDVDVYLRKENVAYHFLDSTGQVKIVSKQRIEEYGKEGIRMSAPKTGFIRSTYYDYAGNLLPKDYGANPDYRFAYRDSVSLLYGFADYRGQFVIPCEYEDSRGFYFGKYGHVIKNGKCGLIDINNRVIIPFLYDDIYVLNEDRCALKKGNKEALSDMQGNLLTKFDFNSDDRRGIGDYYGGRCYEVQKGYNSFEGIISPEGKEIIPCRYTDVTLYGKDLFHVEDEKNDGLYSIDGRVIIPFKYNKITVIDSVSASPDGPQICFVRDKKYRTAIASTVDGKFITPFIPYERIYMIDRNHFIVGVNGLQGIIDNAGREIVPCIYDEIKKNDEGIILVRKDKHWGVIDKTNGKILIPIEYEKIEPYYGNLLIVAKDLECREVSVGQTYQQGRKVR